MTQSIPIEQAAVKLIELVATLGPGEEIVLTDRDRPVAKIIPSVSSRRNHAPGACKGMLVVNQENEEHLRDFEEYMR